ncbi:glycosyltransferase family 4 protein [Citrobacter freundii]|uniref:glycosyltransferase family 4 protein n=1 Tax=Citrobacter freundii TaxID=546 RepID=UPI001C7028EC|nr:glycosyltransferase family 4 protein [Citrobacter freundii]EJB5573594.1 glycosyltransferase family 4 protein [Citrobacter freundii]MBW9589681.1 glycosyltransferase family 4 protein [Citrobacter freundii]HDG9181489.1 glycosyltransferase family 4 protein [Citrobacter freundii]
MKILLVTDVFNSGGREKTIADLANNLLIDGHDVTILILDGSEADYLVNVDSGVSFKKLKVLNDGKISVNPISYYKLGAFLRGNKPDVIHYHLYAFRFLICSFISKLFRVSASQIRTVHTSGLFYEKQSTLVDKVRLKSEVIATKINNIASIGISKLIHENNIKYFSCASEHFFHVYNGLELSQYSHAADKSVDEKIVFVYLARLVTGKNHCFLIDVWYDFIKEHCNAVLLIVGDGDLRNSIKEKIEHLGLQDSVILQGHSFEVSNILTHSDVALFPSSYEGFSISLLEYFASSLPVVAHDISAFREVGIHGYNIYLVSLFDKDGFLKYMSLLYNDAELRKKIGECARETVENFKVEKFVSEHIDIYKKMIERV